MNTSFINSILDKLDNFFANKRTNDKRIMLITPALITLLLIYEFEIPQVNKAQMEKKAQIAELDNVSKDLNEFINSAPDTINMLTAKDAQIKAKIVDQKRLIQELNEKISISEITKFAQERSAVVFASIYELASKYNIKINNARSKISDYNQSGFAPNAEIHLDVLAPSFTSLLAFIDKIEEINEPTTIRDLSIGRDLNASIVIDIWGHLIK